MEGSVLFGDPIVLIGLIIALALNIFSAVKKTGIALTVAGILLFNGIMCYALLAGMTLYEAGAVSAVFFIAFLMPRVRKGK